MKGLVWAAVSALLPILASATCVEWDFPRDACCHEGLPFADGTTGVLVWGGGDTVRLTVGRADLWDHRGGYEWTREQNYSNIVSLVAHDDVTGLKALFRKESPKDWGGRYNPYMLPLGRVVVRFPGKTLASGTLETSTGLGRLVFSDGSVALLAMSKEHRLFALRTPDGVVPSVQTIPSTETGVAGILMKRGFEKARLSDAADGSHGGFSWNLPADEPVTLAWKRAGRDLVLATARGSTVPALAADYDAVSAASVAYWANFWQEGARIRVPDPVLQREFDYGLYRFGAMTDPDGTPAGLQGPWLEDHILVPWNGDYHFNINVQECYAPAFRGGHFRNLLPLFRMILSWRPLLRRNARLFAHVDGYVLPHSVDDRGVCIGGFWTGTIDHASTAWMASYMFRYVRYSGDIAFLKDGAYDFMKGAMRVYRAMMQEYKGRLSIPLGPSPEWGGDDVRTAVGRDPSFQLAAAHRLARDLTDAAKLLGETPDPMWADVRQRLPTHTHGPDGIRLFEGQSLTTSHRHHSHMAGLYPFDVLDVNALAKSGALQATYSTWIGTGTGAWTGWCLPWASILHTHVGNAVAATELLRAWDAYFCNPGHGSLHDAYAHGFTRFSCAPGGKSIWRGRNQIMQMDGQCAAATAVMELLAHEVNGRVEFFKGCPDSWKDVSFENLALSDGRRASGRRINGKATVTMSKPVR